MSTQLNPTFNLVLNKNFQNDIQDSQTQLLVEELHILESHYDQHPEVLDPYAAASEPPRGLPVFELICHYDSHPELAPEPHEEPAPFEKARPALLAIIPPCGLSDLEDLSRPDSRPPITQPIALPTAVARACSQYALYMPKPSRYAA